MLITRAPSLRQKLEILAADAQYDLSCACGSAPDDHRRHGLDDRWLYPVSLQSGGRSLMFKTLLSNVCSNDCRYCPLRAAHDAPSPRCRLSPDDAVRAFLPYWKSGRVIGIFLTSAVEGSPDASMQRLIDAAEILRFRHRYRGYIHLKIIPGASDAAIDRAVSLASAVSLNIEAPGAAHFARLSSSKNYLASVIAPLRRIAALTAPGSPRARVKATSQFVVGASDERDREILAYLDGFYSRLRFHRIYFSAYQRGLGDPSLPGESSPVSNADLLLREHRLYQSDFLLRKFGFSADEIPLDPSGNLSLAADPKTAWADAHPEFFPVRLNRADRLQLLRVPGIGPVGASRILDARAQGSRLHPLALSSLGLPLASAQKAFPYLSE